MTFITFRCDRCRHQSPICRDSNVIVESPGMGCNLIAQRSRVRGTLRFAAGVTRQNGDRAKKNARKGDNYLLCRLKSR